MVVAAKWQNMISRLTGMMQRMNHATYWLSNCRLQKNFIKTMIIVEKIYLCAMRWLSKYQSLIDNISWKRRTYQHKDCRRQTILCIVCIRQPSKDTTSFWRWYNVVLTPTTLLQRWNDVVCLLRRKNILSKCIKSPSHAPLCTLPSNQNQK